ncbi:hypothetical protein MCEMRE212_00029 [Candidatus Nanopelagicaceae bacterium]
MAEICEVESNITVVSLDWHSEQMLKEFKTIEKEFQHIWRNDSTLEFIFHKKNLGLAEHITKTITKILKSYEAIIVVEDDIAISKQTVESFKLALQSDSFSENYACVGGYSPLALPRVFERFNFFRNSRYFVCWGWGTTREIWDLYQLDISKVNFEKTVSSSESWNSLSLKQTQTWRGRFQKIQQTPIHTWDFQFQYMMFAHDKRSLLPAGRIVENLGFNDPRSAHTRQRRPRWMRSPKFSERKISYGIDVKAINNLFQFIESLTVIGDREIFFRAIYLRLMKHRDPT